MYRRTHFPTNRNGRYRKGTGLYKRRARGTDLFMFGVATIAITALVVTATGYSSSGTLTAIPAGNATSNMSALVTTSQSTSTAKAPTSNASAALVHPLNAHRIVCVGDSVTEGKNDPDNWPYHLKARLGDDWEVIDQGVGGARTSDMLDRIDAALDLNPRFVIIMGGINDLAKGESLETIKGNIDTICTRVESHGAVPVLCSVTPTGDYPVQKDELNARIAQSAHLKGYPLIDFYAVLNDQSHPGYADPALVFDGTHPNSAGFRAMGNAIDLAIFTGSSQNGTQLSTVAAK